MMTARLLILASLAWWYCLITVVFPRMTPTSAFERAERPLSTEPTELAVTLLKNAGQFSSARVGYAGMTTNEALAWRVLVFRADAESTFLQLLDTATPAGQLYALAGLRFQSAELFAKEAKRFEDRADEVSVHSGCIIWSARFDELLAQIGRGEWVQDLVSGSEE